MPQIIITTSGPGDERAVEVHRERVGSNDVATDTSSHLLVERIGWALSDAAQLESNGEGRYEQDAVGAFTRHQGGLEDTGVH